MEENIQKNHLYRFTDFTNLVDMIESGHTTLVHPYLWKDKYENFFIKDLMKIDNFEKFIKKIFSFDKNLTFNRELFIHLHNYQNIITKKINIFFKEFNTDSCAYKFMDIMIFRQLYANVEFKEDQDNNIEKFKKLTKNYNDTTFFKKINEYLDSKYKFFEFDFLIYLAKNDSILCFKLLNQFYSNFFDMKEFFDESKFENDEMGIIREIEEFIVGNSKYSEFKDGFNTEDDYYLINELNDFFIKYPIDCLNFLNAAILVYFEKNTQLESYLKNKIEEILNPNDEKYYEIKIINFIKNYKKIEEFSSKLFKYISLYYCFTYAQCWSTKEESDALWQIYDTDKDNSTAIRITLPDKTRFNFLEILYADYDFDSNLESLMKNFINPENNTEIKNFAKKIVLFGLERKRKAFEHEKECRIYYIDEKNINEFENKIFYQQNFFSFKDIINKIQNDSEYSKTYKLKLNFQKLPVMVGPFVANYKYENIKKYCKNTNERRELFDIQTKNKYTKGKTECFKGIKHVNFEGQSKLYQYE